MKWGTAKMNTGNDPLERFNAANETSRKRLADLVAGLSPADLQQKVSYGWSVAMALTHLAFWDFYGVARLDHWEKNGFPEHHPDVEPINDAMRPMLEAISPADATRMVITAAESVDKRVKTVGAGLVQAIIRGGRTQVLDRSAHRTLHLDDIEKALGR